MPRRTLAAMLDTPKARRPAAAARRVAGTSLLVLAIGLLSALAPEPRSVDAAPQPALMPKAWQFDFDFTMPELIAMPDGEGDHRWYWYLPYTVVNNSKRDRPFLPVITVATDQGHIIRANHNIDPSVFTAIRLEMQMPHLQNPMTMTRTLQRGPDHMRHSVAIWPAFEEDVDRMSIFVTGLSGEHTTVLHPATGEPVIDPASLEPVIDPRTKQPKIDPATGDPIVEPKPLLLRKTLMIDFGVPGTTTHPQRQVPVLQGRRWVMR